MTSKSEIKIEFSDSLFIFQKVSRAARGEQKTKRVVRRFCGECKLNVYNLSGMTRAEAEDLLAASEGRLCVRFYKRSDGTVLTRDCPVGWAAIKRRVSKTAAAFASLLFGLLSGTGLTGYFERAVQPERVMGKMPFVPHAVEPEGVPVKPLTEAIKIFPVKRAEIHRGVMGRVEPFVIEGGISNIDEVREQVKRKRRR
jgi:hypothetical protein